MANPKFNIGDIVYNHESNWADIKLGDDALIEGMYEIQNPVPGQTPGFLLQIKLIKNNHRLDFHEAFATLRLAEKNSSSVKSVDEKDSNKGWGF